MDTQAISLTSHQALAFVSINHGDLILVKPLHPNTILDCARQCEKMIRDVFRHSGTILKKLEFCPENGGENYAAIYTADHLDRLDFTDSEDLARYLSEEPPTVVWENRDFYFELS